MRQLIRGKAPACLKNFNHGTHNWANVTTADKGDIWTELEAMQDQRCAYCEGEMPAAERHIEHFRQKGRDPKQTFAWPNLFGSCNRENSCGKHKDRCGNNPPTVLIKPDIEDPERFLVFAPDGGVSPRKGLSTADETRAKETIRIFNLDNALKPIRHREICGYVQTAEYLAALADSFAEEEWMPLLQQEIAATAHLPFATAIKHVLTRQG